MFVKLATLGLLKINEFWSKGFDLLISLYDFSNEILSREANYVADIVMWPKFHKTLAFLWEKLS